MNYLLVCTVLVLFPLNLGWETFYIIKMLGWIFAFMSIKEIYELICLKAQKNGSSKPAEIYIDRKNKVKKFCVLCGAVLFVCATAKGVFTGIEVSGKTDNIVSGVLGSVVTFTGLILFYILLEFAKNFGRSADADNTEDNSPFFYKAEKTRKTFYKFSAFALVNLISDILNRFMTAKTFQAYAGVVCAVSKIVMYAMLIVLAVSVNKLRIEADSEIG